LLQAKGCPNPYDMKKQCAPDGLFKGIKHESEVLPPIKPEDYDSPDKAAKTDLKDAANDAKDAAKDATVSKDAAKDAVKDAAKTDAKDAAKDAVKDAAKDSIDAAKTNAKDAAKEKGASWTEGRRRLLAPADDYKKKELKCKGIHQVGWRAGGLAGWRAGGLAGWRAGGLASGRGPPFGSDLGIHVVGGSFLSGSVGVCIGEVASGGQPQMRANELNGGTICT
jgi:hypothetical protein